MTIWPEAANTDRWLFDCIAGKKSYYNMFYFLTSCQYWWGQLTLTCFHTGKLRYCCYKDNILCIKSNMTDFDIFFLRSQEKKIKTLWNEFIKQNNRKKNRNIKNNKKKKNNERQNHIRSIRNRRRTEKQTQKMNDRETNIQKDETN